MVTEGCTKNVDTQAKGTVRVMIASMGPLITAATVIRIQSLRINSNIYYLSFYLNKHTVLGYRMDQQNDGYTE